MKKQFLFIVIAVSIVVICAVALAVLISKNSEQNKTHRDTSNDPISLTSDIIKDNQLDALEPIDIDLFMTNIPKAKIPLSSMSRYPQTLKDFDRIYKIEYAKKTLNKQVAVIYKLAFEDGHLFAALLFENSKDDNPEVNNVSEKEYDDWIYTGECYFASPELTSLAKDKLKKDITFQTLESTYPAIRHIFARFYDTQSEFFVWITKILTNEGEIGILLGFDEGFDESIDYSKIENSKILKVVTEEN